jgi:hypothetical protein
LECDEQELLLLRRGIKREVRVVNAALRKPTTPEHIRRMAEEDRPVLGRLLTRLNTGLKRVRGER